MTHPLLPFLPDRPIKPRNNGIAMIMDKGLSIREAEDLIDSAGELIDFVKLGFGTSVATRGVKEKIKAYQRAGIRVYPGGTLLEAFVVRGMFDDYRRYLDQLGLDTVEVSDGSMRMDHDAKCDFIQTLAKEYYVLSEVGSKVAGITLAPSQWAEMMEKELKAGAKKVIGEAREGGNVGIYHPTGKADESLITTILGSVSVDDIIWEAPLKSQQVWFIRHFGANVNLGNIPAAEVIPIETLRLGLRVDTFFQFLPSELQKQQPH